MAPEPLFRLPGHTRDTTLRMNLGYPVALLGFVGCRLLFVVP